MLDKRLAGQGRNNISVAVCTKCGRGMIGKAARDSAVDTQPVWWTSDQEGPLCNGRVIHVDRQKQLERTGGNGRIIESVE